MARAAAMRPASSASTFGISIGEPGGIGFERHPLTDHLGAHIDVAGGVHVDRQPEPVQQLRPQFALFGIHRADQHEARVVIINLSNVTTTNLSNVTTTNLSNVTTTNLSNVTTTIPSYPNLPEKDDPS